MATFLDGGFAGSQLLEQATGGLGDRYEETRPASTDRSSNHDPWWLISVKVTDGLNRAENLNRKNPTGHLTKLANPSRADRSGVSDWGPPTR